MCHKSEYVRLLKHNLLNFLVIAALKCHIFIIHIFIIHTVLTDYSIHSACVHSVIRN